MSLRSVLSKTLVVAFLFALLTAGAADRISPITGQPQFAPVNPAFEKYMADRARGLVQVFTDDGHRLGYIPPPLKLPAVDVEAAGLLNELTAPPASYDLRTSAGVTAVRDQDDCGSCWTFATFASMESYLKFVKGSTRDFAEQDMNANHGFYWAECEGGNHSMSTAVLARWRGPFNEADVPYPYTSFGNIQAATAQKHVQDVWFLPDRTSYTANTTIKNAIMANGAIYTTFYWNPTYYNATKRSYCCPGAYDSNHAVAIIGWNDNYAKSNFKNVPAGNGAFLIRNSWGTSWGNSGYFWMSYYDHSLGDFTQFLNAEPTTVLDKIYQYDPYGWINSWGFGDNVAYGANIFTASTAANHNKIKGVSFYTPVPNSTISILIYKNTTGTNPTSGTKVGATVTKTIAHAGYNTVRFTSPYVVTAGKKFSVVVKFTTPGYIYPIPVEQYWDNYAEKVTALNGQSFLGHTVSSWIDMNATYPSQKPNICIKAFAGD